MQSNILSRASLLVVLMLSFSLAGKASAQFFLSMKSFAFSEASPGVTTSSFEGAATPSGGVFELPYIRFSVNFGPSSFVLPGVYERQVHVDVCDSSTICYFPGEIVITGPGGLKSMPTTWNLGLFGDTIQNNTSATWSSFTVQLVDWGPGRTQFTNVVSPVGRPFPFTQEDTYVDNDHLFKGAHYSVVNFTYSGGLLAPGNSISLGGTVDAVTRIAERESDSFWLRFWAVPTTSGPDAAPPLPAVPEPETYAMLLAGLGLIGFAARRRKQAA